MSLQHWILRFFVSSGKVQLTVGDLTEWLANGRPPWEAYHALMGGVLIATYNHPRDQSVGVGDTWCRLMKKCALCVAGQEAKVACGTEQLAGGVKAVIEGVIHAMRILWVHNSQEED